MSTRPKDNPAVIVATEEFERNGLCIVCKRNCRMKKTFRAQAGPLDRKKDGTTYTEDELKTAVRNHGNAWKPGPPCHHLCAITITDKLAGFDQATGVYGLPPADMSIFYGGSIEDDTDESYDFEMGELQVSGAFANGKN